MRYCFDQTVATIGDGDSGDLPDFYLEGYDSDRADPRRGLPWPVDAVIDIGNTHCVIVDFADNLYLDSHTIAGIDSDVARRTPDQDDQRQRGRPRSADGIAEPDRGS